MTQSGYFKCPVRLVKDVFSLIEISVSEKAECSLSELVKETRLFKGKVYRLLGTLKSLEYAGHNITSLANLQDRFLLEQTHVNLKNNSSYRKVSSEI